MTAEPRPPTPATAFVERLRDRDGWYGGLGGPWRLWAKASVAVAVALLVACSALTVGVNPRGELPWHPYRSLVPDFAAAKLELYEAHRPVPGTLIVGTSRALSFPPAELEEHGGPQAFNFGFPGGEIAAVDLVYSYVARTSGPPQRLVYVLDEFAVREPSQERIKESTAYPRLAGEERGWAEVLATLPDVVSPGHLKDAARVLQYTYVTAYPTPGPSYEADGLANRTLLERALEDGTFDQEGAIEAHYEATIAPIHGAGKHADPEQAARLDALLRRALADGARVQVILPPYHPVVLERLRDNPAYAEYRGQTLAVLQPLCGLGLEAYDFSDPSSFGGSATHFSDGYHATVTNGRLALQAMERGEAALCEGGP